MHCSHIDLPVAGSPIYFFMTHIIPNKNETRLVTTAQAIIAAPDWIGLGVLALTIPVYLFLAKPDLMPLAVGLFVVLYTV